jgi:L-amino acid N-acyltransferase YncA/predicted transcriptional regulator
MLSITLDNSSAANFLTVEETPDPDLIEVLAAAVSGRVDARVTQESTAEVALTGDDELRLKRLVRLKIFRPLTIPRDRVAEQEALAHDLHAVLFPGAQAGSRTDANNWRDCKQLAAHRVVGRALFLTADETLIERRSRVLSFGIEIVSAREIAERLRARRVAHLTDPPSITVRGGDRARDEAEIRAVLAPLASDYPGFDGWLNRRLAANDMSIIRVAEHAGRVGAVAISAPKDEARRVVKLGAFLVADFARRTGLGSHLLWSMIRSWEATGVEKVYVTISSRKAGLLKFFIDFGFVIEGFSPRRYQDETAEFVLAKHFVRERFTEDDLSRFVENYASRVFSAPEVAGEPATAWALHPPLASATFSFRKAEEGLTLVASAEGSPPRRWSVADLERILHPVRFALTGRRALVVPIEQPWADAMMEYVTQQPPLARDQDEERLLLRTENAYYGFPKSLPLAKQGTRILFYVNDPVGRIVGEARIVDVDVDEPDYLYVKYGALGIYGIADIRKHVQTKGPSKGRALAMRFGAYIAFPDPVTRRTASSVLGRRFNPQGLTPISFEEFEGIRHRGGVAS